MDLSCLLGIAGFVHAKAKFFSVIFWPYNNSFIDQACLVKMAGYWSHSFFVCVFMGQDKVDIHIQELSRYPVILTEQIWSIMHKKRLKNSNGRGSTKCLSKRGVHLKES